MKTTNNDKKILNKLTELEKQEGQLPLLLQFYGSLLKVQVDIQKRIKATPAVINNKEIESRLAAKQSLIAFDELNSILTAEKQPYTEIISVFNKYSQLFGSLPGILKRSGAEVLLNTEVTKAWFEGTQFPESLLKGAAENDEILLRAIVQAAIKPFLVSYVNTLKKTVNQENLKTWNQGYCPYCGGKADIAYLEKEVGGRWLVCSRCDTDWSFPRLKCSHCLNQDPKMLSFFMDDTGQYRLQVCDKCKCYLKTIDLRKSKGAVLMPLERMLTLEMDQQAQEKGYQSC